MEMHSAKLSIFAILLFSVAAAAAAAAAAKADYFWTLRDPLRSTHFPWGRWGPCTDRCVQFRRRQCLPRRGWSGIAGWMTCTEKYQRQACTELPCTADIVSSNISSFECGLNFQQQQQQQQQRRQQRPQVQLRIYGGEEAERHSWPWHVLLVNSRSSENSYCGGTLIHPQFALTARHCVFYGKNRRRRRRIFVRVGDHEVGQQRHERVLSVTKVLLHPRADTVNIEYDFALLKLQAPVELSEHVRLACLADAEEASRGRMWQLPAGTQCTAIGRGRYHRRSNASAKALQEVRIRINSHASCELQYRSSRISINPSIHLCAGGRGRDTCAGDSGGGLFCQDASSGRWYLHGVTSFGHQLGCGVTSGVFQKLSAANKWIRDTVVAELKQRRRSRRRGLAN